MTDLNFAQIREYPLMELAAKLGLKFTERQSVHGPQFVGTCPISQLPNAAAFKITPSLNRFICFCSACKALPKNGGDIIELMRRMRKLSDARSAAAEVQALFKGSAASNSQPAKHDTHSSRTSTFDPDAYLETLDPSHEALTDLGILPETLRHFQAGYCNKGLNRGRLAVAWCGMDGETKAFIGVALKGEEPQYLLPKGQPMPYWFGCHLVDEGAELRIVPNLLELLIATEHGASNMICPLAPTNGDAITSLKALVDTKNLTIEF